MGLTEEGHKKSVQKNEGITIIRLHRGIIQKLELESSIHFSSSLLALLPTPHYFFLASIF